MRTKFVVGRLYYIKMLDHSVGMKDKMTVELVGWCLEDHKDYAVFTSWQVIHDDQKLVDDNHEPFSVIKSCVRRKKVLSVG